MPLHWWRREGWLWSKKQKEDEHEGGAKLALVPYDSDEQLA